MKKTVAILTPTYNRAHTLNNLYQSLLSQTSFDFVWYLIDDGSTDETAELCKKFSNDNFDVVYKYKENGGKHTALNIGVDIITEPLTFIVDSDDTLTEDAVQTVVDDWGKYSSVDKISALCYYRAFPDSEIVGDSFGAESEFVDTYINVRILKNVRGDKAEVFVTDVLKRFKFPVFENENFLTESVVWIEISKAGYLMAFIPKSIYLCEYLGDGLTSQGRSKIVNNPNGTIAHAKSYLSKEFGFKLQIKYSVLYIAACMLANKKFNTAFSECNLKFKYILSFPLGIALYFYLKKKFK